MSYVSEPWVFSQATNFSHVKEGDCPTFVWLDVDYDYGRKKLPMSVERVLLLSKSSGLDRTFQVYRGCIVDESLRSMMESFPKRIRSVFSGLPYFMGNLTTRPGYNSRANGHLYHWPDNIVNFYYPAAITHKEPIPCDRYAEFNTGVGNFHILRVILPLKNEHVRFLLDTCPHITALGGVNPTPQLVSEMTQRNIEYFQFVLPSS